MATNYPGSIDDGTSLPNPSATDDTAAVDHAGQHDTENDAIKALETKVGFGASTPTTGKVLVGNTAVGSSQWRNLLESDITGLATDLAARLQLGGDITGGTAAAPQVTATHLSAALPINQGGTGQTTRQAAITALTGTQSGGTFLRSDGTNVSLQGIGASDLPVFVGDTGSGGTQGVVPAPAAGDAAANKFLKANGSWVTPTVAATQVNDTSGNAVILSSAATTPVNQLTVKNANTTVAPQISATGTDTNIDIKIIPKGTGNLLLAADPTVALGAATKQYVDNKATTSSIVTGEIPGGLVNASNTVFTTASVYATNSVEVFRNGVRMTRAVDYTESAAQQVTFTTAPNTGDTLRVNYTVSASGFSVGTNSIIVGEIPTGTINGTTTAFTLARAYIAGSLEVFVDGVRQRLATDYTETTPASGIFTFVAAPLTGQSVYVNYQFNLNPSSNADTVDGIHASSTATANQLLALNSNAAFPQSIIDQTSASAWVSWTPTFTNITIGNGTLVAYYTQIGKTVFFRFFFKLGTTSAIGSNPYISLPVTPNTNIFQTSTHNMIGEVWYGGGSNVAGNLDINSTGNTAQLIYWGVSGAITSASGVSATGPFTWASTNFISGKGCYEAA